jgi:hypothetical protein
LKKRSKNNLLLISTILGLLIVSIIFLLYPTCTRAQTPNPNSLEADNAIQQILNSNITFESHKVYLCVWLLNTYSFEYTTGNYIFDLYVSILWTDTNISAAPNWYFTNGFAYPTSEANVLLGENLTGTIRYAVHRVTAELNTPPDAKDYPFDKIYLKISIDLPTQGYNVTGEWLNNQTGIDPYFENAGWKTTNVQLQVSPHAGSLGVERPHFDMVITQEKAKPSSIITSFLPPIFFCAVSAVAFLFSLQGLTPVGIRIGLNNSMLVTTILFLISVEGSVPPSSVMSIFEMFILSVLSFLTLGLIITVLGFALWLKVKDEKLVKGINRWGLVISIILPFILFGIYFVFRS